ncbi:hypothetical protein [Vulcanisaeta distributa]|uniref:hypothetical protein n=1 Tax=Vulcanisaeta distributa TaxID=164451 RepID=UPI001FB4587F|nr:hypothetical protein [Vulcanisaeta distributa]
MEGNEGERRETRALETRQEEERQKQELKVVEHREAGEHEGDKVEASIKEEGGEALSATVSTKNPTIPPTDYSTVAMEEFTAMLRRAVEEELPQNREEGYKVALAMLSYLQRYWSVGELRLKLDIAKQFGGVNEGIMRIEDGALRALRKLGIVEVVEPGVVNRVKELPKDFIKVRLDSLFT